MPTYTMTGVLFSYDDGTHIGSYDLIMNTFDSGQFLPGVSSGDPDFPFKFVGGDFSATLKDTNGAYNPGWMGSIQDVSWDGGANNAIVYYGFNAVLNQAFIIPLTGDALPDFVYNGANSSV